jgi:hypothetical protein
MRPPRDPLSSTRRLGLFLKVLAWIISGSGGLTLVGYVFMIPGLHTMLPGLTAMAPNTALAFILTGLAVWLLTDHLVG